MNNPFGGNPMQMFAQFRSNPAQFFMQRGLNIPANMANDPNAILNHLMQTGKITQQQVNAAYQQMGQFKR